MLTHLRILYKATASVASMVAMPLSTVICPTSLKMLLLMVSYPVSVMLCLVSPKSLFGTFIIHYLCWFGRPNFFIYLKVTIICRYIFLRFWLETPFVSTKFCDLNVEMVQGRQILMFYTTIVHIANDCGYKILRFWANPQKYQTLVPTKK